MRGLSDTLKSASDGRQSLAWSDSPARLYRRLAENAAAASSNTFNVVKSRPGNVLSLLQSRFQNGKA